MKKTLFSLFFCLFGLLLQAQTTWKLQGSSYSVDTLYHAVVGPGITQTELELVGPTRQQLFYTTTDLQNEHVHMRTLHASDLSHGLQPLSTVLNNHCTDERTYVCGVNADFFSFDTGRPCGIQIQDGELVTTASNDGWTYFATNAKFKPYIGNISSISGRISTNTDTYALNNVNRPHEGNDLILYTHWEGTSTGSSGCKELVLRPTGDVTKLVANAGITCQIVGSVRSTSTQIPSDCFVVSGDGTAASKVEALAQATGDITVRVSVNISGTVLGQADQMIGGCPVILSRGVVQSTQDALDHLTSNHPRTAVGFNSTKTKLVLMVVDGRSTSSQGVTSRQLADIMKYVGCSEAMNFDGGGSSELYVHNLGVRNAPSDGEERSVTNGLYIACDVPNDQTVTEIRFMDWRRDLNVGDSYTPVIYGYNQYGILVDTDVKGFTLSCDETMATVQSGSSIVATGQGNCTLTAKLGDLQAEMPLCVTLNTTTLNPFAFGLNSSVSDEAIHIQYSLNTLACSARILFYQNALEVASCPLEDQQLYPGSHTVDVPLSQFHEGDELTWQIEVQGYGVSTPTAIGDQWPFYCCYGAAVDNNPQSAHFGRVYINESFASSNYSFLAGGRTGNGLGVYVFDPYFQPLKSNNGKYGFRGNAGFQSVETFGVGHYDPKTIRIADDGRVFLGRTSGAQSSPIAELDPDYLNKNFTSLFHGTQNASDGVTYVTGTRFMAGLACSFALEGSGSDLTMTLLSCNANGSAGNGPDGFFCNTYQIGKTKTWRRAPTSTFEPLNGHYTIGPAGVNIETDHHGGLWYVQYRATPSAPQPSIKHYNAQGEEDYSDLTTVCRGAGLAVSPDGMTVAIPTGDSRVAVYDINYDTNPILMTKRCQFTTREGANISALAWDYAGNLYVASNSSERVGRYAIPRTSDLCVTPAPTDCTITIPTSITQIHPYDLPATLYRLDGTQISRLTTQGIYIQKSAEHARKILTH